MFEQVWRQTRYPSKAMTTDRKLWILAIYFKNQRLFQTADDDVNFGGPFALRRIKYTRPFAAAELAMRRRMAETVSDHIAGGHDLKGETCLYSHPREGQEIYVVNKPPMENYGSNSRENSQFLIFCLKLFF